MTQTNIDYSFENEGQKNMSIQLAKQKIALNLLSNSSIKWMSSNNVVGSLRQRVRITVS